MPEVTSDPIWRFAESRTLKVTVPSLTIEPGPTFARSVRTWSIELYGVLIFEVVVLVLEIVMLAEVFAVVLARL